MRFLLSSPGAFWVLGRPALGPADRGRRVGCRARWFKGHTPWALLMSGGCSRCTVLDHFLSHSPQEHSSQGDTKAGLVRSWPAGPCGPGHPSVSVCHETFRPVK